MTIRGKVLLFSVVAFGLLTLMGVMLLRGATEGRRLREASLRIHEQRFLLSELRGEALLYLDLLQRARQAGEDSSAIQAEHRERMEARFARLRALEGAEEHLSGEGLSEEAALFARLQRELRLWTERTEARFQPPSPTNALGGGLPRESIEEFGRRVEPLLVRALEREQEEREELARVAERELRAGRLIGLAGPLLSLGLMMALVLAILVPMNRRLRGLLAGAERIGRGELDQDLPELQRDELGILSGGFNRMARELKASQERLLQADRLAALGRTVASVGHEINNPLSYVLSNISHVHEALRQAGQELSAQERQELVEALSEAREGAERVRFIVQDLKSLSRTDEAGTGPVDVAAVVSVVAKMASHELRDRARLVEDCAGVPPVRGNATRLGQVFLNLIVNAAQAIPPGSMERHEIRVAARLSAPGRVTVDVSDTGCGIPTEDLERIFDPFFTTKPVGEGTGLGLAVCQNIIQSLGGTITVDSTPGQGTTFHITLPTASEGTASSAA